MPPLVAFGVALLVLASFIVSLALDAFGFGSGAGAVVSSGAVSAGVPPVPPLVAFGVALLAVASSPRPSIFIASLALALLVATPSAPSSVLSSTSLPVALRAAAAFWAAVLRMATTRGLPETGGGRREASSRALRTASPSSARPSCRSAEMCTLRPKPSAANSVQVCRPTMVSILLMISTTGLAVRRIRRAKSSSSGSRPLRASTINSSTSAHSSWARVCASIILDSLSSASVRPAVSRRRTPVPANSTRVSRQSRVRCSLSDTSASGRPHKALYKRDLPVLVRPTSTAMGVGIRKDG